MKTTTPSDPSMGDRQSRLDRACEILIRLEEQSDQLRRTCRLDGRERHLVQAVAEGDGAELAALGLDTRYAWLDDLVAAVVDGEPSVDIETVGPYAVHHVDRHGRLDVSYDNVPATERAGIAVGALLRKVLRGCANVRFVVLLDDVNTEVSGHLLSSAQRDRYVVEMCDLLRARGVLSSSDRPGRDHLVVRESDQAERVAELIERLRRCGRGVVEVDDHGDTTFRPTPSFVTQLGLVSANRQRELDRNGILLKRRGRPTCQAMDASRFLDAGDRQALHLVMLDCQYKAQQDKAYGLLRAIDAVTQDSFHNVFYDGANLSPQVIALAIAELLADQLRRYIEAIQLYDDWERFDPGAYLERNYGRRILPADRAIATTVAQVLAAAQLPAEGVRDVVDVGTGPNLYPAMLVAPYLADDGQVTLLEPLHRNRVHLRSALLTPDGAGEPRHRRPWTAFEDLLVEVGGDRYRGALDRLAERCQVTAGSILGLPAEAYDVVTSFFVAESITTSRRQLRMAIRSLGRSLRRDGLLIAAHMLGSLGYDAGEGTRFPAVRLSASDLEEAYRDADLSCTLYVVGVDDTERVRDGYQGMAVAVARRTR